MKKTSTFLILLLSYSFIINAQKFSLVKFSSGYSSPVGIENCGDKRLFIVEQEGKIFICDSAGNRISTPYLDITDRVLFNGGEQGLLGLAFDPGYFTNGYFYLNYINKSGNTQISRFKVKSDDPNRASKGEEKFILEIDQPFSNHNGGCIRFGHDGYLYIGMGDGGSAGDPNNNAQNPMSLLGKMLRIDVHGLPYKIPADNPFIDSSNYKHEIWALGLRNPWRWSFDALTDAMFIGDVGQDSWEEVDIQPKGMSGVNYGWRCYEGRHTYNTTGCRTKPFYTLPVYEYSHSDSTKDCSVIGGFVYRGTRYASLYGKYIFTDYCSGIFRLLYRDGDISRVRMALNGDDHAYTSFGEGTDHELYVCNALNGNIYHITDGSSFLQNNYSSNKTPEQNKLKISPNPSNGNISIAYASSKTEQIVIRITNLLGETLYNEIKNANTGTNTWNIIVHIPKGNYYLNITSSIEGIITQNLRIE